MGEIRYISKIEPDGWLEVRPASGPNFSLPYGLRVELLEIKQQREYFRILEGAYKGVIASVRTKASGKSFLASAIKRNPAAIIRFSLQKQALYFGSQGPYNAFSGGGVAGFTPVPIGTYQLSIPLILPVLRV